MEKVGKQKQEVVSHIVYIVRKKKVMNTCAYHTFPYIQSRIAVVYFPVAAITYSHKGNVKEKSKVSPLAGSAHHHRADKVAEA